MARTVFVMWCIIVFTFLYGIALMAVSFVTRGGKYPHLIARAWARAILCAASIRVRVVGLENIDPKKSYIYMSNHLSYFDIPVLLGHLKVQFRWIAKAELFTIPIFGGAMKGAGYVSIDRSNRKAAFESLRQASENIRNGVSVMIFPEGTRSGDGKVRMFKKGGFVMAIDAGVPIMPVVIHGTRQIMRKDASVIRHGNVVLEILKPIEASEFTRKNKEELMDLTRTAIQEAVKEKKEVGP